MNSSWDTTQQRSKYHFDSRIQDPLYDTVIQLGSFVPCWQDELEKIISGSKSATWRTRNEPGKSRPESDLAAEEYDLEREGYGKDYTITNLNWKIPRILQRVSDLFAVTDCMTRIHVQMPGQVWNLHLDKLEKWNPDYPDSVSRFQIQLTDWEPGHFWSYGNYIHAGWRAGDVTTFDWKNVPHSTANAGHGPRVTLQVTGIETEQTQAFLFKLSDNNQFDLQSK